MDDEKLENIEADEHLEGCWEQRHMKGGDRVHKFMLADHIQKEQYADRMKHASLKYDGETMLHLLFINFPYFIEINEIWVDKLIHA